MSLKNKLEGLVAQHMDVLESLTPKVLKRVNLLRDIQGLLPKSLLQSMYVSFLAGCFRRSTWIFSAPVRVGEEDGAAQQRAADRGCAANQQWGMAVAATPQFIIQRSSPSDAFSPGLLEPNLQVLKLDGNPLISPLL
ncbi:nucleosome assembly protein 1;2-like [Panicum virgatum]|uniref:nucleosome assembly protein 1;2-like n=1 Tax=Panicum virgatum TaxID=38727 RepID=UPI0019D57C55|nr:nucleosome assembly protein 1;2-like [Panicum virgatum]